ncbi:hypothetical protein Tco_1246989 [Tanacetum coccineum]
MYETCALRKQSTVRLTVELSPTIILRRESINAEHHGVGISNSLLESVNHTSLGEQVIIPGPVGIVHMAKLCKLADTQEGGEESIMSIQVYIRKVIEDVGEDDDSTRAPWLSVLDCVNVNRGIVTGCFRDVRKFLKN